MDGRVRLPLASLMQNAMKISETAVNRPILTLMGFAGLVVFGLVA